MNTKQRIQNLKNSKHIKLFSKLLSLKKCSQIQSNRGQIWLSKFVHCIRTSWKNFHISVRPIRPQFFVSQPSKCLWFSLTFPFDWWFLFCSVFFFVAFRLNNLDIVRSSFCAVLLESISIVRLQFNYLFDCIF